ncbi:MAG: pyridoxal phosphate-dependent aminotransferase [Bacteroidales bacterium]|jgi:aspartate/methionine/tyrosine aminotransferase|nr:pyridoxal phosphate-dependent aminotransferase [Bacteroidales bacterium]HOL97325.1 pyridoxal phosphate-dependent aminotransferase [Bacteroidales bacterium]HOM36950.1 pyridoxal phosphate-dependent aminotransferase [Bacteroidales bacterium]HPD22891.1 pyridoxal phosphate-dependent aminotransferase [Bacteroidales bacterium]HRS98558.1 pyridoxal phosphate-dependent aminotransferase [Bacteroidales bacterium]
MKIQGSLISYFSNLVKTKGGINLAQGIPAFQPPIELTKKLIKIASENYNQYAPGTGNQLLRQYLDSYYKILNNENEFLITNGATEAISLTYNYLTEFLLTSKEIRAASFTPAYESYIHLPKIFKHKYYSYTINDDIYFDENEFISFAKRNSINIFFVASPGNPYGKIIPKEKMQKLISLSQEIGFYMIIDAVYKDLYFTRSAYYPIDNLPENIFYVNSFSKKLSITGWRLGYVIMNKKHFEKFSYLHDYIGLCAPSVLQQAVAEFLIENNPENYLENIRKKIYSNYLHASKFLEKSGFYVPNIDGGYFIWCKLPENIENSLDFGIKLYENYHTAIIPGQHFGQEWNNYIRINLAHEESELTRGIEYICKLAQNL